MKKEKGLRFHFDIAAKILMLLGFAGFYLQTLFTGSVTLYVHPRIIPYILFAATVMIVNAVLLFGQFFNPGTKKASAWPLLFFIIPLIMAFTLPAVSFDSDTGTAGDIQLSVSDSASNEKESAAVQEADTDTVPDNSDSVAVEEPEKESSAAENEMQDGVLVFNNENYYEYLCDIYADLAVYKGTEVELTGFVYNGDDGFADDEFVAARLLMVCCAADMQTVGLLCRWDGASGLESDTWVKVTGTITGIEFGEEVTPLVEVEIVEMIDKPDTEYIYPY